MEQKTCKQCGNRYKVVDPHHAEKLIAMVKAATQYASERLEADLSYGSADVLKSEGLDIEAMMAWKRSNIGHILVTVEFARHPSGEESWSGNERDALVVSTCFEEDKEDVPGWPDFNDLPRCRLCGSKVARHPIGPSNYRCENPDCALWGAALSARGWRAISAVTSGVDDSGKKEG